MLGSVRRAATVHNAAPSWSKPRSRRWRPDARGRDRAASRTMPDGDAERQGVVARWRARFLNVIPRRSSRPFDRRRHRHTEPGRRTTTRHPALNCRYLPFPQIYRKRSRHAGWPPSPARILNQRCRFGGILNDSVRPEIALVEMQSGSISVQSKFGVGATVTIRFPAGRSEGKLAP